MNCFTHSHAAAVGVCATCGKAVCHACVGQDTPRLVCRSCIERGSVMGVDYRSSIAIAGWPLVHVCTGIDPVRQLPRVARGVIAIGNIAVGGLAIGGVAVGLLSIGGASLGLVLALGGVAVGLGLSIGGLAVGSVAVGGAAIGFLYAIGGGAVAPAVIDGTRCDEAAREFLRRWLGATALPFNCR
jgi:hypothetical protein